jgi:predicted Fe-S protein YdhL (DUF1289 family)
LSGPAIVFRIKGLSAVRHSPCIGICKLDHATGFCLGCGRTGSEVGDWMTMSEPQRDAVWDKLPERLAALSVRVRLLHWIREELVDWVRDTLVARLGTWSVGAPAFSASFAAADGSPCDLRVEAGTVIARQPNVAFSIGITDKVRAFSFGEGGAIVLGIPKGRATLATASSLHPLGPDVDAIDPSRNGDHLFDVGFGRRYSRFCIRTGDSESIDVLASQAGRSWTETLPFIRKQVSGRYIDRIVESAAARIEISGSDFGASALPFSDSGPEIPNSGEEISADLALPDYAASIAIFHPAD